VRAGVEVRPIEQLRAEIAWVHEFWGAHESLDSTPNKIIINGVPGLPPIPIPPIKFPQKFKDSDSVRLGGEFSFKVGSRSPRAEADDRAQIDLRAGVSWETSAVPPAYLSLFTLDFDKFTMSLGAGVHLGKRWRFDAVYTHTFTGSVHVTPCAPYAQGKPPSPDCAAIGRVSPIVGNAPVEAVNGGTYSADANLFGVGAVYSFE
jgi:long-chain fatty acid transport protein